MNRENITDELLPDNLRNLDNNGQPLNSETQTADGYIIDNRYNAKYPILICQIIAAALTLALVLVIKYCLGSYYGVLKQWYLSTIAQNRVEYKSSQPQPTQNDTSANSNTSSSDTNGSLDAAEDDVSYVETGALMLKVLNQKTTVADFGYPLKNYVITSGFGEREDPISGANAQHSGIDLAADSGSEIFASLEGRVETADYSNYYGNYLVLSHGSVYTTLYGHCQKLLVKKGDQVKKGQKIALVGSTGRSTGPHLHFEISVSGKRVNPIKYINL